MHGVYFLYYGSIFEAKRQRFMAHCNAEKRFTAIVDKIGVIFLS